MKILAFIAVLLAAWVAWLFAFARVSTFDPKPVAVLSQGPTVERLERLAQMVTYRVYVADVLVGESDGCKGSWLVKGDALIGVNLARVQIEDRDETLRRATVMLSQPEVLQSRVDHEKTKTWEVKRTSWMPWKGDQDVLRDSVMREAQKLVAKAAASSENIGQARVAAETIIQAFYAEVGWEVKVRWKERPPDP